MTSAFGGPVLFVVFVILLACMSCDGCRVTGFVWRFDGAEHRVQLGADK